MPRQTQASVYELGNSSYRQSSLSTFTRASPGVATEPFPPLRFSFKRPVPLSYLNQALELYVLHWLCLPYIHLNKFATIVNLALVFSKTSLAMIVELLLNFFCVFGG